MKKLEQFIAQNAAAARRFGKARNKPEPLEQKYRHIKVYKLRKKLGMQRLRKPWDYLTSLEVKNMAWQAYRVASWHMVDDLLEPSELTHVQFREAFAQALAERFTDALMAHATLEGDCFPVDAETPPYRNYPRVWEMMREDVPSTWRPEYPLYPDIKQMTPASATNASGALTTADEGNGNEVHFKP